MDKDHEAFLLELLADFKIEAAEHHQSIVNGLIALEKSPPANEARELIENTFREVHSMKGAARAVNQPEIERICQSMESVFHSLKNGSLQFSEPIFDALHKSSDVLQVLIEEIDRKEKSVSANLQAQLMRKLDALTRQSHVPAPPPVKPASDKDEPHAVAELSASRIPAENGKSQPEAIPKFTSSQETEPSPESDPGEGPLKQRAFNTATAKETVRISVTKLEKLLLEAEEFILLKSTLNHYISQLVNSRHDDLAPLVRDMKRFNRSMSRMIDDLLLDIKTTLLYPFSTILEIVPKIARDLGKEFGKEIRVSVKGAEIEIDRRILEELKDPIIHLVRNSIDHGIETRERRIAEGKSPEGLIEIIVRQESATRVELTIRDDGKGIDREKVIQAAIKSGILTHEISSQLSDHEINALIFRSGISTSQFITDISGRGLGMAIVAEKVTQLGGAIITDSIQGQGTSFMISLPVTLATFRGILVKASGHFFVIPTPAVDMALRVHPEDFKTASAENYLDIEGKVVSLVRLGDLLGLPQLRQKDRAGMPVPVIVVSIAQKRIAFAVDEVYGEQESTVKSLGPQLQHVRHVSGAIILGNGQVIPILNMQELIESAIAGKGYGTAENFEPETDSVQKRILVAEDSVTLRSLLRNILEAAGYVVQTAVDGMDAFQLLSGNHYDLLVSDVEMPRMNGFDLTKRIRSDKKFAELPVILVTALDSATDKQRGMEAGADAYIVKGNFEQSNLLETIRRLI